MTKPIIAPPGSMTWDFRLGDRVRDKISGLEGIAMSRFFHVTGCDRFMVETPAMDGKAGENIHVDGARLELVESFPERHLADETASELHVKLGDRCRSRISQLTGVATIIHVPLFGATQVCLDPQWDPKTKKMPEAFFADAPFVEVLEPYTPLPAGTPAPEPSEKLKSQRGSSRMPNSFRSR